VRHAGASCWGGAKGPKICADSDSFGSCKLGLILCFFFSLFYFDLFTSRYSTEDLFLLKLVIHDLFCFMCGIYIEKAAVASQQGVVLLFRWEPCNLHSKKKTEKACYEILHRDSHLTHFCKVLKKNLDFISEVVSWLVELLSASQ
jgi:hypothetical protein